MTYSAKLVVTAATVMTVIVTASIAFFAYTPSRPGAPSQSTTGVSSTTRSQNSRSPTTQVVSVTASGNGSQSSPVICLKEISGTASITSLQNSTFEGYAVTYANGTQSFFSLDSRPVPAAPDLYIIASAIESNPGFIAAERGAAYEVQCCAHAPPGATSLSTNSTGSYAVYWFYLFSSQKIYYCSNFWTYTAVGGIYVTVPINGTTDNLELSRQVQTVPVNELNSGNVCL